jgi:6-phosphogluconate dehydrogenase
MELGMIGLGRMGANLVRRARQHGHDCVVYDIDSAAVDRLVSEGATGVASLTEMVGKLSTPRIVWVMLPAALVDSTVDSLASLLSPGDVIIDGGNSFYRDDITRSTRLQADGLRYLDIGTSGGVHGLDRGYCLMIGGDAGTVARLSPLFDALAPGVDAAERTPGRTGEPTPAERGWLHCGPSGAGHFVKMVHNGIEYGVMAAYAEGLAILNAADLGSTDPRADAETAPLADPEYYRYPFDTAEISEVWRRGSVIGSWLLDLTAEALHRDPTLSEFTGQVSDSGEGRWTTHAAVDTGVPAHVLTAALYSRFSSRGNADFADRTLSAMRKQFGGHDETSPPGRSGERRP